MNRVKLIFKSISEIVGTTDIGLLVLVDEQEERQIVVTCDKQMIYQLQLRMQKKMATTNLLPEVLMCQLKASADEKQFEIMIVDLVDGQYHALLMNDNAQESVDIRASDAILLSLISDIPIYIDGNLMNRQSAPYLSQSSAMSLPINVISDEMLKSALDKAIKDEDYEMASHLRDEMKRRLNLQK